MTTINTRADGASSVERSMTGAIRAATTAAARNQPITRVDECTTARVTSTRA
jgi:hypothetical protein